MSGEDSAFAIIRERAQRWMEAWRDQDLPTLEDTLAADYSLIISSAPAERIERDRWLAMIGTYVASRVEYLDVEMRRMSPDLVVMSSVLVADATMGDVDRSGRFFCTDLWREENGLWKVCARFSSPLFDDSASINQMSR
jgi:ketosteroid isomerase-like protein